MASVNGKKRSYKIIGVTIGNVMPVKPVALNLAMLRRTPTKKNYIDVCSMKG